MRNERCHEKRVVLEDIPSDDTMISSLALCVKEFIFGIMCKRGNAHIIQFC